MRVAERVSFADQPPFRSSARTKGESSTTSGFAGHVAGYLTYDLCHYYLHHGRPKAKWLIRLRAHHMNHHHNKEGRKYGVSTTLWDHVFRTY